MEGRDTSAGASRRAAAGTDCLTVERGKCLERRRSAGYEAARCFSLSGLRTT
jgi:hypothetical protein